jgi:hypothetical protein
MCSAARFTDASFAERGAVKQLCGLPTKLWTQKWPFSSSGGVLLPGVPLYNPWEMKKKGKKRYTRFQSRNLYTKPKEYQIHAHIHCSPEIVKPDVAGIKRV